MRSRAGPVRDGLDVGAPGKTGELELAVAPRGGITRVTHERQRAPLYIYRPVYLDPQRPDMAFVFLLQAGDGLVQGDRYRIAVDCAPGSALHLTTQAATNVFAAPDNLAAQEIDVRVGADAVLEYMPDPVVPFRSSRFFQRTRITADADSTVILAEMLLPGRVAREEMHVYDFFWAETEARRPNGALLFADVLRLCPSEGAGVHSLGLLGSSDVVATLYVVTQRAPAHELVELLRNALTRGDVLSGASELPNGCGVSARIVGSTSKATRAAVANAWGAVRLALVGAPPPDLRRR